MAENHYDLDYTGSMVDRILDTGYDLQNQGYIFRGLASHYSGTPTERTWLIAPTGSTGFGLSSPVPPGSIGICMYNGSSWSAEVLNTLTLDSAPTTGSGNGITSGAVKTLAESITNAIGQLEQSVSDRFTSMELEDTTGSLQAEVLSITLKYVFEGEEEALTSLSILAATAEKAGLMSAADKQKLDAFVTNIRSLRIQDTTAQADQGTEITNTLKWTIGGVTEAITAFTLYAATTSKAGLMSAADKTALDTLPSLINAGYLYAGIATPSTVPSSTDAKIFYIAIQGGTYTSFGNLNVTQGINIIYKSGNAWSVAQAIGIDDEPTAASGNFVKSGGVANKIDFVGKWISGTVDRNYLKQSTDSVASIWFQQTPKIRHIDKIRFLAKTGTTNFYVVDISVSPASIRLIKTITSSASEDETVKEFDVSLDLMDSEFIGINGAFRYWAHDVEGYTGGYCNPNGTGVRADNPFVVGFETSSLVKNVVSNNTQSIDLIKQDIKELQKDNTIGPDLGAAFPLNTDSIEYIWGVQKPDVRGKIKEIQFKAKAGTINIYKITAALTVGQTASVELIASVVNSQEEEGNVKSIATDISIDYGDYIGLNGAFYYIHNGSPEYKTFTVKVETGKVDAVLTPVTLGCNLKVIGIDKSIPSNMVFVDANGTGDYTSPFDAMVALVGKDTAASPYTIVVAPGVYNMPILPPAEFFAYCKNRYLSIVGTDKNNCILRNDNGYYNASASQEGNQGDSTPLKISGNIYLANLTIISTDTENASEEGEVYHSSYCIHIDADAPEGSIMEVHNCRLVNNHAPCIGFGIPKNVTLKITDCELEADFYAPNIRYGGAILYGHDRGGSTEIAEEHLFVKGCTFISPNGHAVKTINNQNAMMDCVFVNNACALPDGKGVVLGDHTTVIPPSFGNSIEAMNA